MVVYPLARRSRSADMLSSYHFVLQVKTVISVTYASFSSIGAQVESEHVLSRLWIGRATAADSGNYSCSIPGHGAADFPRARVRVHVVDGERKQLNFPPAITLMILSGPTTTPCFFKFDVQHGAKKFPPPEIPASFLPSKMASPCTTNWP